MRVEGYSIHEHTHHFAAWAAGRAASTSTLRMSVDKGRRLLEAVGFAADFATPDLLPDPSTIDTEHRRWRASTMIHSAKLTEGIAAKLINVYLKARFVCGGFADHPSVTALHPPIDRLLLNELGRRDFAGQGRFWRRASQDGWSTFDGPRYEEVIDRIRAGLDGKPMWMIESHWRGHQ
jgi:hypothetical protein